MGLCPPMEGREGAKRIRPRRPVSTDIVRSESERSCFEILRYSGLAAAMVHATSMLSIRSHCSGRDEPWVRRGLQCGPD
jgi:hypothetical protein